MLVKLALQAVLKDEGFLLPSDSAKEAHLAASQMLEWLATNADLATHLAEALVTELTKCINCKKQGKMWRAIHDTRTHSYVHQLILFSTQFTSSNIFMCMSIFIVAMYNRLHGRLILV